ncbi:hypothetical protein CUR178_00899 [Leishmania enriettii]|uniref:Uncharacterized protein n=1 Tax=Leishmania enriettii TaxID=5663 RepID=A0A836KIV0_LEIEN|nr:hypothetical protein CUR178_00899 [Leishmania enriettii]
MSDRSASLRKGRRFGCEHGTPSPRRRESQMNMSAFSRETSLSKATGGTGSIDCKADRHSGRRASMLPLLRVPVLEEAEEAEASNTPDPYATSPFRGASPSILSMVRAGSISSENMPPPPDIQHIEGQLWYVTKKNDPGNKKSSLQWVVCEDQRLSIYSSWAPSSRLVEELNFERVHILFDFLHPHRHPEVMSGGAPKTRRMTIHRNEPRTSAESRYAFQIRDPHDAKTRAGYYYFGVECVMRDPSTERLRRSLAIFCTDRQDDHRKWIDFWEEMQVRYPVLRNRNARSLPTDTGSEVLSDFVFPPRAVRRSVLGQSEREADMVSSAGLPSPIDHDYKGLATTNTPRWTDSDCMCPNSKGSTPPPPYSLQRKATSEDVRRSLMVDLPTSEAEIEAGSAEQWIALLADAECQAREGIVHTEAATRSVLEANETLSDFLRHVAPTGTVPSPPAVVCCKGEGAARDGAEGGGRMCDGDTMHALQAELKALCAALEGAKSAAAVPAAAREAVSSVASAAVANQVLLAAYERELAELRGQNAALKSELDTQAANAANRVERALGEWTLVGAAETAVFDEAHEGGGGGDADDVSPARRQRYLAADETLVQALVEAALVREWGAAASASRSDSSSSAHIDAQDDSASDLQALHTTLSINAGGHDGVITAERHLSAASDSHQPWRALSRDAQLPDASSATGGSPTPLMAVVQQHLSMFATEHGRRLGGSDPKRPAPTDRGFLLYHVVSEIVTGFNDLVDAPHTIAGVPGADGSGAASVLNATAVPSWLSVLHRCLFHRTGEAGGVCDAGASESSPHAAAATAESAPNAASAAGSAASLAWARRLSTLPPLTDDEKAIVDDLHHSVQGLVAWIRGLLGERQRYAACVAALDSLTCRHDVFRPLKEVQWEFERASRCFEAAGAAAAAAAAEGAAGATCARGEAAIPETSPLEADAGFSTADDHPKDTEQNTADGTDALTVECRLKARLQHAVAAFDSRFEEAAALRRLLTTILYGSEAALRNADSIDEVAVATTTGAAAACEAFLAAQEVGSEEVETLRGAAEACVAERAREEVWANALTPAVLQGCADALTGDPCIQDMVHSLQLKLGHCPERGGRPLWADGAAYVPPLSLTSLWSLVQELHERLAAEQARCNQLLREVMLISAPLACSDNERLASAYATAMAATAKASTMTNEAFKAWAVYQTSTEAVPGQQRCLHEVEESKADTNLSTRPEQDVSGDAHGEGVYARLVAAVSGAEDACGLRRTAFDVADSLLPSLSANMACTRTALLRLFGVLLRHGAGTGVLSPEALAPLLAGEPTDASSAVDDSDENGASLGVQMKIAANATEELLSGIEEVTQERREWMQQLLRWLKDFSPPCAGGAAPEVVPDVQCDASNAHEVYARLLEELAIAEGEHMSRVAAVEALSCTTSCTRTISVPEMIDEADDIDIAVLAPAIAADIAEALRVPEAYVNVTSATADPVERMIRVSATITHSRKLTRASVLGAVYACPCPRLRGVVEGLSGDSAKGAAGASGTGGQSPALPVTVDSPEGISCIRQLARSLEHCATKQAAVVEFEKRVTALLPMPQDTVTANAPISALDATSVCNAGQALAAMLATELGIQRSEANFCVPDAGSASVLDSLADFLQHLHDASLTALHNRNGDSAYASLEKLRAAVDALHGTAMEKLPGDALEELASVQSAGVESWPRALLAADLRDLYFIIEHLAGKGSQAASLHSKHDSFQNMRAIAEVLGLLPDAYAGEWDGERVPSAEQLVERARAVMECWKERLEVESAEGGELEAAVRMLVKLKEAVDEAGVVAADVEDDWWAASGRRRWEVGCGLVGALSAAVEVSREELADVSERVKVCEDQLMDVERDHNESREAITAAVGKLRFGLGKVDLEDPGEVSPPSSSGSTVCGPLFTSLRQLTSEVSDVAQVLRKVKLVLEEHNAEEMSMPGLEELSFPVSEQDSGDGLVKGKVVTYEDVVTGVHAKVDTLRKERAKRMELDTILKNFVSAVASREKLVEEEPVPRRLSLTSRRCMKPKAKPQSADYDSSVSEEFSLPRTPLCFPTSSGTPDLPLGCSASSSSSLARWAAGEMLERVRHQMNQTENAIEELRVAVAMAYEALGGEHDVANASDNEAARLLVELAQSTADSIASVKRLLDLPEKHDAATDRREPLSSLVARIKEKLEGSSGRSLPTLLHSMEEGMQLVCSEIASSRRSPGSSMNRHLPRKQKPSAPESADSGSFHLSQQVVRSRESSSSSPASTLKVPALPPPGPSTSAEDFEKEMGFRMQELDALRRGCSVALRALDYSVKASDTDSNALITHLTERCNDVRAAMQITDAIFQDDNMISEVSAAVDSYKASSHSANEHPLLMRCSALVRAVKCFDNLCESMRHIQDNMAKQQRFLIHNEAQNTEVLRRALVELEEQLRDSNAERVELQKAREATEEKAADLSSALKLAQDQFTNMQNIRSGLDESLAQLKRQHDEDADALDRAKEKLNSLSSSVETLQRVLGTASNVVREEVLVSSQRLHLVLVGREMPKPEMLAEGNAHDMLLPTLCAIAKALQSAVEELTPFAAEDKRIAAVLAEERTRAAQQAATLKGELASVAAAKEEAEARAKAAAKHLRETEDAFQDEIAKLKRALRSSEAMLEDEGANHQRRLRQAQAAAEDQLAAVQQRLDRAARALTEEEHLRAAAEENAQKLRGALAEAEAELARQKRRASEEAVAQREGSMRRIESLEEDFAAARVQINELTQALDRARRDGAKAARALEAGAQGKAKVAAELEGTRTQLRAANDELGSICASILSTGLASSMTSSPSSPVTATRLLAALLHNVEMLQSSLEANEAVRQRHQSRGTQCEDAVAETLAALEFVWAAAVKHGRTPARLKEAWLTPMDKAEVLSNALTRDDSAQLDDLAVTRQRLLDLLCRLQVRHQGRLASLESFEKATTADLVQVYHDTIEGSYEARQAALERELQDSQSKAQILVARLQEQEEQHAMETAEVEIRIGRMREMVQSKIIADEVTEQHMRETEAAARAHFMV